MEKYKCLTLFFIVTIAFASSHSFAQTNENSDSKDPKQSREKSNSVKSGVSQGLSVREAMTLTQVSSWSYSVSSLTFRSLDQYDDNYWSVGGDVSYRLKDNQSIAASISYYETFDKFDEDPERFGISDLNVSWLLPMLWKDPRFGNLSLSFTLTAPLSERSKRETFLGGLTSSATLRKPLSGAFKFLTLSASGSLVANLHTYDTVDAFGTDQNSPIGVSTGFGAVTRFSQNIFWSNSYSLYNRMGYDSDWITIQSLSTTLELLMNQNLRVFGQYRWRDRVVTNDSFLDDDKSQITMGLSYFF